MSFFKIAFGKRGEIEAARVLKKNGYKIIEKNYRCRFGEIDIIAKDGETIVFVEVKTRGSENYGRPEASVDARKQKHMIAASMTYLSEKGITDNLARFDVVSVSSEGNNFRSEIIKDAFEAEE